MKMRWAGTDSELAVHVLDQTDQCLSAYRAKPNLVEQDAGIEISNVEGGYGRKQLLELVQNAADAMVGSAGRIALTLANNSLYCANEGKPLSLNGIETLMASHISRKRDDEIGRFGLGFKSVLGITDRPEIFSRSVSVRFDRATSERIARSVAPKAPRTPVLRIGIPIDPQVEADNDPVLDELMNWATTIVRLPLKEDIDWLGQQLVDFPPEFLLFSNHVHQIDLRDDKSAAQLSWTATRSGDRVVLATDKESAAWRVFRTKHEPTLEARKDAGTISGRARVDLAWAVPDKNRSRTGVLWSYFPTNSQTTLAGIVNAPFKTNEDRHDVLKGEYNRELLTDVLPALVSRSISELVDPEDPASILEVLPGRGREARSWADDVINEPIMSAVASGPCLPDMNGELRHPSKVKLQPAFLSEFNSWKPRWAAVEGRPSDWVHETVDRTAERRAKAERLLMLSRTRTRDVAEWLHDLAAAAGVVGSQEAIKLAVLINIEASDHMVEMRRSAFVLGADGKLKPPISGRIFLPESADERGVDFVDPRVCADTEVVEALKHLGIGRLDQLGRLRACVSRMGTSKVPGEMVEQMWNLTRGLPVNDAKAAIESALGVGNAHVRTLARRAERVGTVLLPGVIVPADGSRDAALTIDTSFHAQDLPLLRSLGAVSEPQLEQPSKDELWFKEWDKAARAAYSAFVLERRGRVPATKVRIISGRTFCGLDIAEKLSDEGRRALTEVVLRGSLSQWTVDATSNSAAWIMPFANPAVWWMTRHGVVDTAFGAQKVKNAYASISGVPDALLPVAKLPAEHAAALGLRDYLREPDWHRILLHPWLFLDQARLNQLYGIAAKLGAPAPVEIGVVLGAEKTLTSPELGYVTVSQADYELISEGGHPAVLATDPEQMAALVERWGMRDALSIVQRSVLAAVSGEPTPIGDKFTGLRAFINPVPDFDLVPCSDLSVEVSTEGSGGPSQTEHGVVRDGDRTVYFRDDLSDEELLRLLSDTLRLGLSASDQRKILDIGARGEVNKLRNSVRKESNQDRKLVMLAGVDALRKELPPGADKLAESRRGRKLTDEEVAAMARVSKGAGLLSRLAPAIEEKGLVLPQLSGGVQARAAIQELGLPAEFAGTRSPAPAPRFEVIGPVALPPLHQYQEKVVGHVLSVLRSGGNNRGLVALPTGSGKTRVAVEAIIRFIAESQTEPLIVWIAQSDELCEQAVETWSYTWSAIAQPGEKLTISRLWGANDATSADEGAHLVVATDAKLLSLSRKGQHEWLADADVVLVDEAHTSISKTYTELFRWLKRGARERDRVLLGLSASPYRGHNAEQTQGLVNRYDSNLLTGDAFGDDPHRELQDMGILAKVRHHELEGMTLTPGKHRVKTDSEAMHLDDYRIDLNEVAGDERRNQGILDSLESLPTDMTALVFAASVQHAEVLAAVLGHAGVPSAAIAGYTPANERRRLIERFKTGDVRVLTNYNVLSQGFDAPKVGAVYVTRPTFSPNRYQQMIGRGLRGPKNGGSEEVLIVNVKDNIDAFGTQLAFHHFDKLWTGGRDE